MNGAAAGRWRDYLELTKPRVVALMVFTALIGMVLADPWMQAPARMLWGAAGIALMASAAAAVNQLADRELDARMARTRARPLPRGAVAPRQALRFAAALGLLGFAALALRVNMLTAWLTLGSLLGYALVYTRYLKRATPQNIVIGGAAGAAPPLLGWTAVTGSVDPGAVALFLIIFAWTPPHFWALALHRKEDYAETGVPMLPVTHGDAYTRLQITLYTLLLTAVSLLPFAIGLSGLPYLGAALALDAAFLGYAAAMQRERGNRLAMPTFAYSIVYLMGLFLALLIDRYLGLFWSGWPL